MCVWVYAHTCMPIYAMCLCMYVSAIICIPQCTCGGQRMILSALTFLLLETESLVIHWRLCQVNWPTTSGYLLVCVSHLTIGTVGSIDICYHVQLYVAYGISPSSCMANILSSHSPGEKDLVTSATQQQTSQMQSTSLEVVSLVRETFLFGGWHQNYQNKKKT